MATTSIQVQTGGQSNTLTVENCTEMDDIANFFLLRMVLIIHTLFSVLAIPLLIFYLNRVLMKQLMPFNTRFIIIFNVVCLFVHLLSRIYQYMTKLLEMFRERSNGCEIIPDVMYCFYVRLPYNCGLYLCYSTTIMIAFERLIATIYLHRYNSNRSVGPLLVFAQ
ncbi:hypothetical protein NECAME_07932, partial [Necator americanus]